MFAGFKLLDLFGVAGSAGVGIGHPHFFIIGGISMFRPVAL
jgi:hypothetical protein